MFFFVVVGLSFVAFLHVLAYVHFPSLFFCLFLRWMWLLIVSVCTIDAQFECLQGAWLLLCHRARRARTAGGGKDAGGVDGIGRWSKGRGRMSSKRRERQSENERKHRFGTKSMQIIAAELSNTATFRHWRGTTSWMLFVKTHLWEIQFRVAALQQPKDTTAANSKAAVLK